MNFDDCISYIVSMGQATRAIGILANHLEKEREETLNENANLRSSLIAIKKINKGRNNAIDALCENEN